MNFITANLSKCLILRRWSRLPTLFVHGFITVFFFYIGDLPAQIQVQRFEKDLNLSAINNNFPYKIVSTKDSGYCVLGVNASQNNLLYSTITLTRLDKSGTMIWSNNYSVVSDSANSPEVLINTFDNGFIVAGSVSQNGYTQLNTLSPHIFKIDSAGNLI